MSEHSEDQLIECHGCGSLWLINFTDFAKISAKLMECPLCKLTQEALDKLERLEKNELKNSEALLKITGILSNLFGVDSDKQAAKGFGGKEYVS